MSFEENTKQMFTSVSEFGSVEEIKFLVKATSKGRRSIITRENPDIDLILKSLCPVLNQELYVSHFYTLFASVYSITVKF